MDTFGMVLVPGNEAVDLGNSSWLSWLFLCYPLLESTFLSTPGAGVSILLSLIHSFIHSPDILEVSTTY